MEAGGLTDERVETLGTTLMLLQRRMEELREAFGLTEEDLALDLGLLGRTVERRPTKVGTLRRHAWHCAISAVGQSVPRAPLGGSLRLLGRTD